jgi:hypothetical protein
MPCAGVIHRYPSRCLQSRSQHVTGFVEEAILLLGQQPLNLSLGDRQAHRLQQGRQPGQRRLALVILHQHEAAQVRAEMANNPLGQRCANCLAVRRHPAFTPVADRMHRQHKLLDKIGLVALEA